VLRDLPLHREPMLQDRMLVGELAFPLLSKLSLARKNVSDDPHLRSS